MANGLRKLIKRARKEFEKTTPETMSRRFNQLHRLKADELEERIAP